MEKDGGEDKLQVNVNIDLNRKAKQVQEEVKDDEYEEKEEIE